nr:hypothetical protein [Tanacetum cinerariifolium]
SNSQQDLKDKGVIDSGCSRHMTRNKSYLIDYEEIDAGFVAFGGNSKGGKITGKDFKLTDESHVLLKVSRKDNMYSVDLKNVVPQRDLTCLFTKAISNESTLWHMILGHGVSYQASQKTLYVLFLGRKPVLSFMRPFGCPVTILNTIDHLGSGPNWIFDIDALTKSMNYKPIIVGNQSNGSIGNQSNGSVGKARVETVPDNDYILLPLWTQDPPLSSSLKDSPGAGYKQSGEEEKKDTEDPENEDSEAPITEEPRVNQEKDSVNSTNRVNAVSLTINAANNEVNAFGRKSSIELPYDLNMPDVEDISIFEDSNEDVFGAETDLNNMESTFQVNLVPTIRIHKDHPLEQVIRDLQSAPQTRR